VEFWIDRFYVFDLKKGNLIVSGGIIEPMEILYNVFDTNQLDTEPTAIFYHTHE
jgi:hypothetical protein